MTTTTNALATLDGPPSAHDPVLWRFVARVQALTPAEWGKLDALAAPLNGRSPLARARRLRLLTAMFGGWWREPMRDVRRLMRDDPWLTLEFALELMRPSFLAEMRRAWKDGRAGRRPELPADLPPEALAEIAASDARAEDSKRASQAIWAAARAQSLGPGAAYWALMFADMAIYSRDSLTPELLARLYAYMEPVIPYASLTSA